MNERGQNLERKTLRSAKRMIMLRLTSGVRPAAKKKKILPE